MKKMFSIITIFILLLTSVILFTVYIKITEKQLKSFCESYNIGENKNIVIADMEKNKSNMLYNLFHKVSNVRGKEGYYIISGLSVCIISFEKNNIKDIFFSNNNF